MDSLSSGGPQMAGFLDLPGELRNEIYQHTLRSDKEQRLVLKLKTTANGTIVIKKGAPTLYHTLPTLRNEIMSVYYASNSFRISLTTPHRRELFRKWIGQCEGQLKDLKHLKVGIKIQRAASKDFTCRKPGRKIQRAGYQALTQVSCSLQISLNADGQLDILHAFQGTPYCRLCSVNTHHQAYRHALLHDTVAELLAKGSRHVERLANLVVIFALGVCLTLDAVHKGEKEFKAVHWLQSAGGKDYCHFCPARVEISVL